MKLSYSAVVSTMALVIAIAALCVGGALAGGVLVTSKQIKNGSILTQDLHKNSVKGKDIATDSVTSSDIGADQVTAPDIGADQVTSEAIGAGQVNSEAIGNGDVSSADIGNGQVGPQDVNMPDPSQLKDEDVAVLAAPTLEFQKVDDVGTYTKEDATSDLEVDWTGSVKGENGGEASGCVFQLRVDGQPAPSGGGEVFAKGLTSVSATALFGQLPTGAHAIEIWARVTIATSMGNSCIVGPAAAGIGQTVVVSEQVL
jgi:hypothetical protein